MVKVGVRLITVGLVVLVRGQNFTQEVTPHVSCCLDIERQTAISVEASEATRPELVNRMWSELGCVEVVVTVMNEVAEGEFLSGSPLQRLRTQNAMKNSKENAHCEMARDEHAGCSRRSTLDWNHYAFGVGDDDCFAFVFTELIKTPLNYRWWNLSIITAASLCPFQLSGTLRTFLKPRPSYNSFGSHFIWIGHIRILAFEAVYNWNIRHFDRKVTHPSNDCSPEMIEMELGRWLAFPRFWLETNQNRSKRCKGKRNKLRLIFLNSTKKITKENRKKNEEKTKK